MERPRIPRAAIAWAGAVGVGLLVAADGITMTGENEAKLITTGGEISGVANTGFGMKWPLYQGVYSLRTDVREINPEPTSAALQNGAITAQNIESGAFIRLNGTQEEREETVAQIYRNMNDFDDRVQSLAEKALRDVVRQTVVASADEGEEQEVTSTAPGRLDFLNSEAVGEAVQRRLQREIDNIISREINIGTEENPEMVPAIEVTAFRVGNFEWDDKYETRRDQIAQSRAAAEQARFKEAEAERNADAERAEAAGDRDAAITRAAGQADAIRQVGDAEAAAISARIEASGGAEQLVEIIRAERWNGWEDLQVLAGEGAQTIVDARDNNDGTVPSVLDAPNP